MARAGIVSDAGVELEAMKGEQYLPFAAETWEPAIKRNVPAKWFEMNLAAFAAGRRVAVAAAATGNAGEGERA